MSNPEILFLFVIPPTRSKSPPWHVQNLLLPRLQSYKSLKNSWLTIYELIMILILFLDLMLDLVHRLADNYRTFFNKLIKNKKFATKFIIVMVLFVDFVYYRENRETTELRFARFGRPCNFFTIIKSSELYLLQWIEKSVENYRRKDFRGNSSRRYII